LHEIRTKRMNQKANTKKRRLSKASEPVLTEVIFGPFNMGWACDEVGARVGGRGESQTSLSAVDLFYVASHREV
jgi:hypothetical protein